MCIFYFFCVPETRFLSFSLKKKSGESNNLYFKTVLLLLIPTVCLCVPVHNTLEMKVSENDSPAISFIFFSQSLKKINWGTRNKSNRTLWS